MATKMYEHQERAFSFIQDLDHFALFMEMGTGKSRVIVEKTLQLYRKGDIDCILLISPNAVKPQWVEEQFPLHYPNKDWNGYVWDGAHSKKSQEAFHKGYSDKTRLFVFSANVEAFQSDSIDVYIKALTKERRLFVVVDESTRIKNGRRKPTRGKRAGAKRTNKLLDFFKDTRHKAILTGTPTPKNPFDLWSQFEFLKQDYFGRDYFYFTHHYGILVQKATQEGKRYSTTLDEKLFNIIKSRLKKIEEEHPVTPRDIEEIAINNGLSTKDVMVIRNMGQYSAYKNLKELKELMSPHTFFINKKDCLDLPDKVYEKLYCEMGKEQTRLYKELKRQMFTEYQTKELTVTTKMVLAMRLQMVTGGIFPHLNDDPEATFEYSRIADSGKLSVLLEDLEEVPEDVSVIIWAQFRGEIDQITEALREEGYVAESYYGGSKDDVIDRFKSKETRFLVANPLKGGEGLNLQVSTLHYFYSNSFKADSRLQAEDRSHRIGQTNKVTYKDLICKGTVDEHVHEVLKRKGDLIDYFRTSSLKEFMEL